MADGTCSRGARCAPAEATTPWLEQLLSLNPGFLAVARGPEHVLEYVNPAFQAVAGHRPLIGRTVHDAFADTRGSGLHEALDRVYATGVPYHGQELELRLCPGQEPQPRYLDIWFQPARDAAGEIVGVLCHGMDLTARVRQQRAAAERLERHVRQQEVVAHLGAHALSGLPLAPLVERALGELAETLHADAAAIWQLTGDGEALALRFSHGETPPGDARISVFATHPLSEAMLDRRTLLVEDSHAEGRCNGAADVWLGPRSCINVLIRGASAPFGVLSLGSRAAHRFAAEDVLFAQQVADLLGQAVLQEQAERALRASEERHRTLLENSTETTLVVAPDRTVLSVSEGVRQMLGYEPAELTGRPLGSLAHPDDLPTFRQAFRRILSTAGEPVQLTVRARRRDGSWCQLEGYGRNLLEHPAVGGVVCNVRDVTEEQAARAALQHAHQQITALVETSPLPIVVITPDLRVRVWNGAAERVFGYTKEEAIGNPYPLQPANDSIPPGQIARACADGGTFAGERLRRLRKDGKLLELEFWNAEIKDTGGQATLLMGIFVDVTEHRLLESQLHQAQKMEAVGRLAGGVAHDFNNILTALGGYAELMRESLPAADPLMEGVQEMLLAVDRAARLTQQLLAFSRKQIVQPRPLDLNIVLVELRKLLRRVIGEDVEMELRTSPELGLVHADPGQIEQIIVNLAVNARDAMPGGGRLVVETAVVHSPAPGTAAHGATLPPGEYAMIAVSDTGCGIPEHLRERIFEPFFTTKDPARGTGLGLATVYGIVHQSGGEITVETAVGHGTTFRVFLPVSSAPALPARAPERPRPEPPRGAGTVLLAEDDAVVRALTRQMLRRDGYRVLEAGSGDEALALAARHEGAIDLLLTDLIMPRMNGRELAERLHGERPLVPVLYMSGYSADVISHQGVLDEGIHFLQKPFTATELAVRVRQALGLHTTVPSALAGPVRY